MMVNYKIETIFELVPTIVVDLIGLDMKTFQVVALIDTGASHSAIYPSTLDKLNAKRLKTEHDVDTNFGTQQLNFFDIGQVGFDFVSNDGVGSKRFWLPNVMAFERLSDDEEIGLILGIPELNNFKLTMQNKVCALEKLFP